MKHVSLLFFSGLSICLMSCSSVFITTPPKAQNTLGSPHDLVVTHSGCGQPEPNSIWAVLDYDTDNEINISSAFQYVGGAWIAENYPLPLGEHKLNIHADVHTSGWCFVKQSGDSHTFTVLDDCPPDSYCAYFLDNSNVANVTIHSLDQTTLTYFWEYIEDLEAAGAVSIEEPVESQNCVEPDLCYSIQLTADEKRRIHAAKMAHAIWLDKNTLLPWRLRDCSQEEFACLFEPEKFLDPRSLGTPTAPHDYFISIVDYSPSDIYQYAIDNDLIKSSKYETMWAVLDNLRTTDTQRSFIHGSASYNDPTNTAHTLHHALTYWSDRGYATFRIARSGCHSMARIVVDLLNCLNIAGEVVEEGQWMANLHASAIWPGLSLVLPHGDDIYSATLRAVPSDHLLPRVSFYSLDQNTSVCGDDVDCLSKRHKALLAIDYPDNYTLERGCNPTQYGYTDCRAYLVENYGEVLTEDEINSAVTSIQNLCQ